MIDKQISHVLVKDNADFGFEELKEIREANKDLHHGKNYCVLLETGSFTDFSKKAKEASTTNEFSKGRIGLAVLINSLALKMLLDIYLRVNKPKVPTKPFHSKKEAIKWLQEIRDLNNSNINKNAS